MKKEKCILFLDDEKTVLDSLKAQLKKRFGDEFVLEMAESADEAMEVLGELVEDGLDVLVVVSDWLMPGMKGDEFLIQLHKKHPQIVKILLTGQADQDAVERAIREANLHKCLSKPWDEEELIHTIETGLNLV